MLVNIIQNTISSFRSALAAASVITTNLKMWLGFETSETLGRELAPSSLSIVNGSGGGTITQISENSYSSSSDGNNSSTIRPKFDFNTESGKTYKLVITPTGTISGTVHFDFNDGVSYLFEDYDFTTTKEIYFTDNGLVFGAFNGQQVYNITGFTISVKELTQITPDKSGNNNVGELFTGKALDFNGSTDYVDVSGFSMSGNNATFSFWAYIEANIKGDYFFDFHSPTTRFLFGFGQTSQKLAVYSGGWEDFGDPPQDQWVRIVLTVKGTIAKCFVDGVQLGTDKTISTFDFSSATTTHIGARYEPESTPKYYDGLLSDFQVYDKVWLNDDVAYDYANPNKLAIDNPNTSLSVTNLKAYWALSEGDGLVAYDSGTNLEEEEVTNGDFATDSDWTEGAGWDIDVVNNKATCDGTQTNRSSLFQTGVLQQNVRYQFEFTLKDVTNGNVRLRNGIGASEIYISDKSLDDTYIVVTEVIVSNQTLVVDADVDFIGSVTNISVREITASDHGGILNGATYVDAQPRIPQLGMMNWSKGSNLITYSENFTDNSWTKLGVGTGDVAIVTSNFDTSPIGTQNATRLQCDLNGGTTTADQSLIYDLDSSNTSQCISIYMKSNNGSNQNIYFTNTFTGDDRDTAIVTTDWQRFEFKHTTSNHTFSLGLRGGTGSDDTADILIWGAQSENSSSVSAYRLTDGAATLNSTVIPNPTIPTKDIFGNLVRDRLNSFNLDGSGYAEVADDTDLDFGTGAFSCDGWVKFKHVNTSSINCIYTNGGQIDVSNNFGIGVSSNKIVTRVSSTNLNSTTTFSDNVWIYFALTRDNLGACKLYINGNTTPEATAIDSDSVSNSLSKQIGRDSSNVRHYNDLISDVRLYDTDLSATEIENNYNAGLSAHTN